MASTTHDKGTQTEDKGNKSDKGVNTTITGMHMGGRAICMCMCHCERKAKGPYSICSRCAKGKHGPRSSRYVHTLNRMTLATPWSVAKPRVRY
jgi:hypothetical protein